METLSPEKANYCRTQKERGQYKRTEDSEKGVPFEGPVIFFAPVSD
jgi:hypothetical protein